MTKCVHSNKTPDLHFRLSDLSDALICAKQNLYDSRFYNRKRLAERAAGPLKVGDTVMLRANERLTFTNYLDPQFEIIKVRGVVYWLKHQLTGKILVRNRAKILLVDPNVCWDQVRQRPVRNPKHGMRLDAKITQRPPPIVSNGPQAQPRESVSRIIFHDAHWSRIIFHDASKLNRVKLKCSTL